MAELKPDHLEYKNRWWCPKHTYMLEQIVSQGGASEIDQSKYSESASFVECQGNFTMQGSLPYKNLVNPYTMQQNLLGQGNLTRPNVEVLPGGACNIIPKRCSVMN